MEQSYDRLYVMQEGKVVEEGYTDSIINNPSKEYTKKLILVDRDKIELTNLHRQKCLRLWKLMSQVFQQQIPP